MSTTSPTDAPGTALPRDWDGLPVVRRQVEKAARGVSGVNLANSGVVLGGGCS